MRLLSYVENLANKHKYHINSDLKLIPILFTIWSEKQSYCTNLSPDAGS